MWPRSLSRHVALAAAFPMLVHAPSHAAPAESDYLAGYRNRGDVQGLYEIREAARAFLKAENARRKHEFTALGPDIRIFVPRCAVPLKARWARQTMYNEPPGVDVVCTKSVGKKPLDSWDVFVYVTSPQMVEEARRMREAKARAEAASR